MDERDTGGGTGRRIAIRHARTPCSTSDTAIDRAATRPRTAIGRGRVRHGCSGPHGAQAGADIDAGCGGRVGRVFGRQRAVAHTREAVEDLVRDEARARRVDM
jgi:hypothetical protein